MSSDELMDEWRKTKTLKCAGPNPPQPALTDKEREAVEAADAYMSAAGCHNTNVQKTLRGLLERTKTV